MHKAIWFILGFLTAGALVAALILGPLRGSQAEPAPEPNAEPEATAAPSPTPSLSSAPGLVWLYRGYRSQDCRRLELDEANQAHYGPCHEGLRLAYLTPEELITYRDYLMRYAGFDYAVETPQGPTGKESVTLHFIGKGSTEAEAAVQQEIARWTGAVYDRLREAERRSDLVAQARLDLSRRLGMTAQEIEILAVESVVWPDTCLGLHQEGHFCAQVRTEGYRITLAECATAACDTYEYRTDLADRVVCSQDYSARMTVPPLSVDEP